MLCFICFPLKSLIKNEKRERVEEWVGVWGVGVQEVKWVR